MSLQISTSHATNGPREEKIAWLSVGIFILGILGCVLAYFDGLRQMTLAWATEEYSHAPLIPFISLFLILKKFEAIEHIKVSGTIYSLPLVCLGLLLLLLGEKSALLTLVEYGYLVSLVGLFVAYQGIHRTKAIWVGLAYLIFMIPLPTIVQNNLSNDLQLISSQIGVFIVRLFGISVYLEGNVIDLGSLKLQVVEACSGLRYLFPLMSFGFLIAALYRGKIWQKITLFLSTIFITVFMNSFRIGVIGVTSEYWGKAAAEGFLHDFEGWIIFIFCLAILYLEMKLFLKLSGRKTSVFDNIDIALPDLKKCSNTVKNFSMPGRYFYISIAAIILTIPISIAYGLKAEIKPDRMTFNTMPLYHKQWIGEEKPLTEDVLGALKLTDYFNADFTNFTNNVSANFYVAYYDSQKKGAAIHSPKSCIPGGGWQIKEHTTVALRQIPINDINSSNSANRLIIQKGEHRSIVYYWFQQRGRMVTNEYLNRWYIFWDSLTRGRSDGALVRFSMPWPEHMTEEQADEIMNNFIADFYPLISQYVPD